MKIQIERKTDSQLPLIDSLPSLPVGQLEGYNGVGKSLTVRVLEVCAGQRPLMAPEAWKAFCNGIGKIVVTATELEGAKSLSWEIDGEKMHDASESVVEPQLNWFSAVRCDGKKISSFGVAQDLFAIERIAGEIGLVETLAAEMNRSKSRVSVVSKRIADSEKLLEIERLIDAAKAELEAIAPVAIESRRELASEACNELEEIDEAHKAAVKKREKLDEIVTVKARLLEIQSSGANLDSEIAELEDEISKLRVAADDAAAKLKTAEDVAAKSEEFRKQVNSETKKYEKAVKDIERIGEEMAHARQASGLKNEQDPDARREELEAQLDDAQRRRNELDSAPAVVTLIDEISPGVQRAVVLGLADQVLLERAQGSAWTVSDVSRALSERRDRLGDASAAGDTTSLDKTIEFLRAAIVAIEELPKIERRRELAVKRRKSAEQLLEELGEKLDAAAAKEIDALRKDRQKLDEELYAASSRRSLLRSQRDALGTPGERAKLAKRFENQLKDVGVNEADLQAEHASATRLANEARDKLAVVAARERAARGESERDLATVASVLKTLESDERFEWLGINAQTASKSDASLSSQLEQLQEISRRVELADSSTTNLRELFLGLEQGLAAVSHSVLGGPKDKIYDYRVGPLTDWLSRWAREWFEDPDVSAQLFGAGASKIAVDLEAKQVSWADESGEPHAKPFEGLSSGEQAFAFTSASLSRLKLRRSHAANRLIVLDEFGAFVSHDSVSKLSSLLTHWQDEHPSDQILVILPANKDYRELERATTGETAKRYARMADKLDKQQWFVESFAP